MRTKLLKLGLTEPLVDEILNIFDAYKLLVECYSKPKGLKSFKNHLNDTKFYANKLQKELEKLSGFEKQFINYYVFPSISELKTSLVLLKLTCQDLKNKKIRFSRKKPFLRQLTLELWEVLERHGITVTVYRDNMLCHVLDVCLDANPDNDRSFNLLREVSRRKKKQSLNKLKTSSTFPV